MSELQLEIERHRKTWRQLEQVTGLLKQALEFTEANTCGGPDVAKLIDGMRAALSRQPEPVEPTTAQDEREAFEAWWTSTPILKESKRTIAEKAWQARATRPAQTEQQPEQSGLALPRAQLERIERRLTDWLELNCCECESGHSCGRNEVTADRDVIRAALSATPSPAKRGDA